MRNSPRRAILRSMSPYCIAVLLLGSTMICASSFRQEDEGGYWVMTIVIGCVLRCAIIASWSALCKCVQAPLISKEALLNKSWAPQKVKLAVAVYIVQLQLPSAVWASLSFPETLLHTRARKVRALGLHSGCGIARASLDLRAHLMCPSGLGRALLGPSKPFYSSNGQPQPSTLSESAAGHPPSCIPRRAPCRQRRVRPHPES